MNLHIKFRQAITDEQYEKIIKSFAFHLQGMGYSGEIVDDSQNGYSFAPEHIPFGALALQEMCVLSGNIVVRKTDNYKAVRVADGVEVFVASETIVLALRV